MGENKRRRAEVPCRIQRMDNGFLCLVCEYGLFFDRMHPPCGVQMESDDEEERSGDRTSDSPTDPAT